MPVKIIRIRTETGNRNMAKLKPLSTRTVLLLLLLMISSFVALAFAVRDHCCWHIFSSVCVCVWVTTTPTTHRKVSKTAIEPCSARC